MKLKYDFHVREIAGDHVLIPMGEGALAFSGMVSTNEVGAVICDALKQDTTYNALLDRLCSEFEVDRETAGQDLDDFLNMLRKANLLQE